MVTLGTANPPCAGSIPAHASEGKGTGKIKLILLYSSLHAGVAKLVDALALGASGVTHGGSSPLPGTQRVVFEKHCAF